MAKDPFPRPGSSDGELARFFDAHDMTDYEDEFEDVDEAVIGPNGRIVVNLPPSEVDALSKVAESRGITEPELIREWVLEKLHSA